MKSIKHLILINQLHGTCLGRYRQHRMMVGTTLLTPFDIFISFISYCCHYFDVFSLRQNTHIDFDEGKQSNNVKVITIVFCLPVLPCSGSAGALIYDINVATIKTCNKPIISILLTQSRHLNTQIMINKWPSPPSSGIIRSKHQPQQQLYNNNTETTLRSCAAHFFCTTSACVCYLCAIFLRFLPFPFWLPGPFYSFSACFSLFSPSCSLRLPHTVLKISIRYFNMASHSDLVPGEFLFTTLFYAMLLFPQVPFWVSFFIY